MNRSGSEARKRVRLGHISGVHGVRGWVKVHSLTEPRDAIFDYQPWLLGDSAEETTYSQAKEHGKKLIALFEGISDRNQAEGLVHQEIWVYRDQFPELAEGEYYWSDLVGMTVKLENGETLGTLQSLMATGANDVMVVKGSREYLVPFVQEQYVKSVNLEGGEIIVDWDPEF